jgi:hypothetical protein
LQSCLTVKVKKSTKSFRKLHLFPTLPSAAHIRSLFDFYVNLSFHVCKDVEMFSTNSLE